MQNKSRKKKPKQKQRKVKYKKESSFQLAFKSCQTCSISNVRSELKTQRTLIMK